MLTSQPRTPIATSSVASSPSNTVIPIGAPGDQRAQQMVETGIVGSLTGAVETPLKEVEEVGKGLRNEIGQYNCFLNVVIQVAFSISNLKSTMNCIESSGLLHLYRFSQYFFWILSSFRSSLRN
jgi:hypothetical protein